MDGYWIDGLPALNLTLIPDPARDEDSLDLVLFPEQAAAGHNLTADGIITGAPVLDAPALGQTHLLTAAGLTSGAAELASPSMGQVHQLGAAGISSGAVVLGTPSIGQTHVLVAVGITTGVPTLGTPSVSQDSTAHLTADDLVAGAPVLDSPILMSRSPPRIPLGQEARFLENYFRLFGRR